MSKLDDKFIAAIEEIKTCFVVAQAMAKNSFKISEENTRLREALKKVDKDIETFYLHNDDECKISPCPNCLIKQALK